MRLNEIRDRPGATRAKKRLGRGIGSGLGKTSGRGTKGQKARSGVAIKGFEGGQMPLHRRLPKRGFNNVFAKKYNELNLGRIQAAVDSGRLDGKSPITVDALKAAGLIRRSHDGVRLLGHGEIKTKLAFEVIGASASAIKAVEAAGGTVTLTSPARQSVEADAAKKRGRRAEKASGKARKAEGKGTAPAEAHGAEAQPTTPAKSEKQAKGELQDGKPAKPKREGEAPGAEARPEKTAKADEARKPKSKPAKKDKA
jgi:large subunit ribosomal protein L15